MKYTVTNVGNKQEPRRDQAHLVIEADVPIEEAMRILNAARKAEREIEQEKHDRVLADLRLASLLQWGIR